MQRRFCCEARGMRAASPQPRESNRKSSSPGNKERASAKAHIAGLLAKRLPSTRQVSRSRNGASETDSRSGEKCVGTAVVARAACHIKTSLPRFLTTFAELRKNGCPVVRSTAVTIVGLILSLNKALPKYSRNMSSMRFSELISPMGWPVFGTLLPKGRFPHSSNNLATWAAEHKGLGQPDLSGQLRARTSMPPLEVPAKKSKRLQTGRPVRASTSARIVAGMIPRTPPASMLSILLIPLLPILRLFVFGTNPTVPPAVLPSSHLNSARLEPATRVPVTGVPIARMPASVSRVNVMVHINLTVDDPVRLSVLAER